MATLDGDFDPALHGDIHSALADRDIAASLRVDDIAPKVVPASLNLADR
jgi:hypothetical protein